jgi:hypothetical protein
MLKFTDAAPSVKKDRKILVPICAGRTILPGSFVLILFMFFCHPANAQGYKVAVGVRLSNSSPTLANGITAKTFLTDTDAAEAVISFGARFGFGLLYEKHKPLPVPGLSWLYGGGLYLGFENRKTYFGPTAIIALDYKFTDVPINLTLDYKPELDLTPKARFIPDAFALSIRFTIK